MAQSVEKKQIKETPQHIAGSPGYAEAESLDLILKGKEQLRRCRGTAKEPTGNCRQTVGNGTGRRTPPL
eukprot:11166499-Lingulodinium_polyedra.AAC.1